MLLTRFHDLKLGHISYLVGCPASRQAAVVDPARDPDPYLAAAEAAGLTIVAVLESHVPAAYLSGARELAERTQAQPVLGGPEVTLGSLRLQAVATPGPTPEHVAWLLTEPEASPQPRGLFSGNLLLAGDVGHPMEPTEESARQLFASLQKLAPWPDGLSIWPSYGDGDTTLGYERSSNRILRLSDQEEFVRTVLRGRPNPPPSFAIMRQRNAGGCETPAARPVPPLLPARQLPLLLAEGALVLDLRSASAFSARMPIGAVNLPWDREFVCWSRWFVPYDRDLFLITDRPQEATRDLASIGLDRVAGYFLVQAVETLPRLARLPRLAPEQAQDYRILDVGAQAERSRIPESVHIPLGELPSRVEELAGGALPLAVFCESEVRSTIAASLLYRAGFCDAAVRLA